jgi:hypothetical protein
MGATACGLMTRRTVWPLFEAIGATFRILSIRGFFDKAPGFAGDTYLCEPGSPIQSTRGFRMGLKRASRANAGMY